MLQSSGRAKTTVEGVSKRLKMLDKNVVLDSPKDVKTYICSKNVSNGYKQILADSYTHYVRCNRLRWIRPRFVREQNAIRIPTTSNIDKLIACSGPKYSLIISILKETGVRPCELERVRLRDVDLKNSLIYVPSRKGCKGRAKKLGGNTVAMLKRYISHSSWSSEDRIFPTSKAMTKSFGRHRNRLAKKLEDPAIKNIRLYDLRHYYATMLYWRTKDILLVKEQLGHRRIQTTLIYTQLVKFSDTSYIVRAVDNVKDATSLLESGFQYVATTPQDVMMFRKPK